MNPSWVGGIFPVILASKDLQHLDLLLDNEHLPSKQTSVVNRSIQDLILGQLGAVEFMLKGKTLSSRRVLRIDVDRGKKDRNQAYK